MVLLLITASYLIGESIRHSWALLITWPMNYGLGALILSATGASSRLAIANLCIAAITYPLGIAGLAFSVEALAVPGEEIFVLYASTGLVLVLRDVLRRETVTTDVILGALTAYILLGVAFALVYNVIANINPGAFSPSQEPGANLFYFSFVTLTTVGYGDIAPGASWLRSIAVVEGLTGQLFLVVLVARLVGMEIAQRTGPR